ncbi:MAG: hypothetical protein ATN36_05590 [Epulopiscium sp. Nele67-Bin005]|nr:MAG: hypothetical protein ATN36_05590 [Epulopiscium sp. Nele67-Bin005]
MKKRLSFLALAGLVALTNVAPTQALTVSENQAFTVATGENYVTPEYAQTLLKQKTRLDLPITYLGLGNWGTVLGEDAEYFHTFQVGYYDGYFYVHKHTGRVYGYNGGSMWEYSDNPNYVPSYNNQIVGMTADKAMDILHQTYSVGLEYVYLGLLGNDYTLGGESGENIYMFATPDGGTIFYINKNTGKAYTQTTGGLKWLSHTIDKPAIILSLDEIINIAAYELGSSNFSYYHLCSFDGHDYYGIDGQDSPRVRLIIRDDGKLFDAYSYTGDPWSLSPL